MSEFSFVIGDTAIKLSAQKEQDVAIVKTNSHEFNVLNIGENLFQITSDGTTHIVAAIKLKDIIYVDIEGSVFEIQSAASVQNPAQASHHHSIKDKVFAPMPGKIVKVMVKKGDSVTERQPLAVVEAMKMENQIASPADGKVKAVNFSVGDQVNTTSPIIELELSTGQ
jgi:biotin carboxyl carrier protein